MASLRPYFPRKRGWNSRRWKITWRFPFTRGMEVYQANPSQGGISLLFGIAVFLLPSHVDVLERAEVAPGGGRPSRIMRVERVKGATWEEAMPPLAPSDRSPTATPELNCSTICLSKCHHELNFSCPLSPPRTTFKSRFDKRIKWFVPWIELYIKTIIISLSSSDDEKYFSNV